MAYDANQWNQISDIIIYTWKSGGDTDAAINAVAEQMGMDAVYQMSRDQWDYMFSLGSNIYNNGYANNEVAAQLAQTAAPWFEPPPPDTGPGSELTGDLTSEQRSAKANLDNFLSQYGLETLGDYVWKEYLNNIPIEQIMLDIRGRPEYISRFPAMKTLQEKGHTMSEGEYIQYEKQVGQIMHAVGFDPAFYDQPSDFAALLENELSINEVAERIQTQYRRVHDTDPAVRQAFADYFGIEGDNALAMTFLDPDRALPVLEKMASSAVFGGLGATQGFQIGADLAGTAAGMGVTADQARQGFSQLAELRPLLRGTISEGTNLSDEEAAAAMFDLAQGARTAFTRRAEERQARFAGNAQGGALAIQQGQIGLGTAPARGMR